MTQEKLITQLCEVIKESEINAVSIHEKLESIMDLTATSSANDEMKNSVSSIITDAMSLLQTQDLHRQKIERVVNFVCEQHGIDPTQYNIAPSAKCIDANDACDAVSQEELEALIKQMA
jgi:hypothetical protein